MFRTNLLRLMAALLLFMLSTAVWIFQWTPSSPTGCLKQRLAAAFERQPLPLRLGETNVVLIIGCTVRKDHLRALWL